ncbi:MAG TPA: deoxyhypusine synthase family protein [Dehalococcoidia bacterium]|nr:deoxyhypusine synthase family protein [Dehalococcoidia bacterium]
MQRHPPHQGPESRSSYEQVPVRQVHLEQAGGVRSYVEMLAGSSYQGRELGRALHVFDRMLETKTVIFLALAGAMIPAGMRGLIVDLLEQRLIDGIVSTGANVIHDIVETMGQPHYAIDAATADDSALGALKLNRVYDTIMPEEGFVQAEHLLLDLFDEMDATRPYNSRELVHFLGRRLSEQGFDSGMVTTAAKLGLPLYIPAVADSELGIDMLYGRLQRGQQIMLDTIGDVGESSEVVWQAHLAGAEIGIITIGGGTPRNFIQQTAPCLDCMGRPYPGHKYAIGVTTDVPYWGGLSGSTFEEAESWRKYNHPEHATVRADATIVFPLLCSAAYERVKAGSPRAAVPRFGFENNTVQVSY